MLKLNITYSHEFLFDFREELQSKLLTVMGITETCICHDDSYVLTSDNTKKILAILMRFRYAGYLYRM